MLLPPHSEGRVTTPDGAEIPYVTVGTGPVRVAAVPGAGDGLSLATDAALPLIWFFRRRAHRHQLLVLSRRQPIPPGYTVDQHAADLIWAMGRLQWGPTVLECESAGGPIGQWISVKRPDLVRGLVLASTFHRTDDRIRAVIRHWIGLADANRWTELRWSIMELTFRPQTVARFRLVRPLLRLMPRPRYPERFHRLLGPLLALDNRSILAEISCPTLVIAGADDRIVSADLQREMAGLITRSHFVLSAGYGHGNHLENPEYERQVDEFVQGLRQDEFDLPQAA